MGYLLPACSLAFLSVKLVYLTGSSSVWGIFGLILVSCALVSWQFLEALLKHDKAAMLLSLVSTGGISWVAESAGVKLVLTRGTDSLSTVAISLGFGLVVFEATDMAVRHIALQFPFGTLARLVKQLRATEVMQAT